MYCKPANGNYEIYSDKYNVKLANDIKGILAGLPISEKKHYGFRRQIGGKPTHWIMPGYMYTEVQWLIAKYAKKNIAGAMAEEYGELEPIAKLPAEVQEYFDTVIDKSTFHYRDSSIGASQTIMIRKPFPYQAQGIAQGLKFKRFINGDQPGLGKSIQAIGTVVAAKCKCILVVCPSKLKYHWQDEFRVCAGLKSIILNDTVKNNWHIYFEQHLVKVFITNYDSLEKFFVQSIAKEAGKDWKIKDVTFKKTIQLFDAVIFDEFHTLRNPGTNQAKLSFGLSLGKEYVIGLSGTPIVNRTSNYISLLHIIGQIDKFNPVPDGQHTRYFKERYCGGMACNKNTNLSELNYKLFKHCYFRRLKKDVLKDLPEKIIQVINCDLSKREEAIYKKAENEFAQYLKQFKGKDDAAIERSLSSEVLAKIGYLKTISAGGKIEAACDYINEITEAGEKVGIFIEHKEITAELKKIYPNALVIDGDTNSEDVDENVFKFQNHPQYNIIILSAAAKEGLTLTAASNLIFIELPWHNAGFEQRCDRVHRIGQPNKVIIKVLLGEGTIDARVWEIIQHKESIANTVNGGEKAAKKELLKYLTNK